MPLNPEPVWLSKPITRNVNQLKKVLFSGDYPRFFDAVNIDEYVKAMGEVDFPARPVNKQLIPLELKPWMDRLFHYNTQFSILSRDIPKRRRIIITFRRPQHPAEEYGGLFPWLMSLQPN